jgi:hypothetical protein
MRLELIFRVIRPLVPTSIHEVVREITHRNYQKEQLAGPHGVKGRGDLMVRPLRSMRSDDCCISTVDSERMRVTVLWLTPQCSAIARSLILGRRE